VLQNKTKQEIVEQRKKTLKFIILPESFLKKAIQCSEPYLWAVAKQDTGAKQNDCLDPACSFVSYRR
jgi:hypothetical protein